MDGQTQFYPNNEEPTPQETPEAHPPCTGAGAPVVVGLNEFLADLRSRINPAYENRIGTESYERKRCADTIAAMQTELSSMTQAVGLATTLKGDMLIRPDDPVGMIQEVCDFVKSELTTTFRERNDAIQASINDMGKLAALQTENAELRANLKRLTRAMADADNESAELRKDAARYRWLCDNANTCYDGHEQVQLVVTESGCKSLAAAIDAAMKSNKPEDV